MHQIDDMVHKINGYYRIRNDDVSKNIHGTKKIRVEEDESIGIMKGDDEKI